MLKKKNFSFIYAIHYAGIYEIYFTNVTMSKNYFYNADNDDGNNNNNNIK